MNCSHIEELLPAYALGALEPPDRQAIEEHLDECPYCPSLAREYLEAVTTLAAAAPSATPPPQLRDQILARIGQRLAFNIPLDFPTEPSGVVRARWSRLNVIAYAAAASLALVIMGVLLIIVLNLQGDVRNLQEGNQQLASTINELQTGNRNIASTLDDLQEGNRRIASAIGNQQAVLTLERAVGDLQQESQELVSMVTQQRSLAYVSALPGVATMQLDNTGQVPTARAMLMFPQDMSWGILVSEGLPTPDDVKQYQVWFLTSGGRMDAGVFTVDETGYGQLFIRFPAPLHEFLEIGIVIEPLLLKESPVSISNPVFTGKL